MAEPIKIGWLARVSWLFVGDAGFPQVRGTDETGAL